MVKVDYRVGSDVPVLSARMQECFGLAATPCVDDGRVPGTYGTAQPWVQTRPVDNRPRQLLAECLLRGEKGTAPPLSQALLARQSP